MEQNNEKNINSVQVAEQKINCGIDISLDEMKKSEKINQIFSSIKLGTFNLHQVKKCDQLILDIQEFCKKFNEIDLNNIKQIIWHWYYNKDVPICMQCHNNKCKFISINKGYTKFCCQHCSYKYTCLQRYGSTNIFSTEHIKNKIEKTSIEKYGTKWSGQSEEAKEKRKNTNILKYGVDNPAKAQIIKDKASETINKNFRKNRNIASVKKYKESNLHYQGSYEYKFLEECEKLNILDIIKRGKFIKYINSNKESYYYPDFYYETLNLIIEIKSTYTYNLHKEVNELKKKASLEKGYNFIFIIDNKFEEFQKLLNI